MPGVQEFSLIGSTDPEQPAFDLINQGRAKLLFGGVPGNMPTADKPVPDRSGIYIAEGYMGAVLPTSVLDLPSDPGDWSFGDLPIYDKQYTDPPPQPNWAVSLGTPIDSTMVGGPGTGHWVFRKEGLHLPPSATVYHVPLGLVSTHWSIDTIAAPGENLYLYEVWLDNEGDVYITDDTGTALTIIGSYGAPGSGWGSYYRTSGILSAKPGPNTIVIDKRGDTGYDGLSIRISQVYNNGGLIGSGSGWILGSISIGDEASAL